MGLFVPAILIHAYCTDGTDMPLVERNIITMFAFRFFYFSFRYMCSVFLLFLPFRMYVLSAVCRLLCAVFCFCFCYVVSSTPRMPLVY